MCNFARIGLLVILVLSALSSAQAQEGFDPDVATRTLNEALIASVTGENGEMYRNTAMLIESPVFSYVGASGIARADTGDKMTINTPYVIASIGKTMTAIVILQMWEEGLLGEKGLDVPLADLDVFPAEVIDQLHMIDGVSYGDQITIRHLLTHTSGLKDVLEDDTNGISDDYPDLGTAPGSVNGVIIFDPDHGYWAYAACLESGATCDKANYYPFHHWIPWDEAAWRADPTDRMAGLINFYLASGMNETALAVPGESFHYADTNFNILGLVIEKLSGYPLHEELKTRLFDPLGMSSTYLHDSVQPPAYPWDGVSDHWLAGVPVISMGVDQSMDWGAGGEVSTLQDLARFMRALVHGELFQNPSTLDEMISYPMLLGDTFGYGMGLVVEQTSSGGLILMHTGAPLAWMIYFENEDVLWVGTMNDHDDFDRFSAILTAVYQVMAEAGIDLPPLSSIG